MSDLSSVKRELERRQREAALARQLALEEQARLNRERNLFRQSVGEVVPLEPHDRRFLDLERERPEPIPRQRELDEQAALHEALSDEMDVETLLETDESLSFRRKGIGTDVLHRLRRGRWAIQGEVDLHGLRRDEARQALQDFLRHARRQGWRCVRVVHGKGLGSPGRTPVLKSKVRAWLVQTLTVLAFVQAKASEGGHGAVVVLLAPTRLGPSG